MKNLINIIFLSILFNVSSFAQQDIRNILDTVKVGMTVKEIKGILQDCSFVEEPLTNYGIDSESSGIAVYKENRKLIFIWKKYNTKGIYEIVILDSKIEVDGIIKVGSTLEEYLKVNPDAIIEKNPLNEEWEYAYSTKDFYTVEFNKESGEKVAEYNEDYSLKKILNVKASIDRIRITK